MQIYTWFFFLNFRKQKRRIAVLEELSTKGWKTEETRAQIKKTLKIDFMWKDDECDDGFITHPPSWQNDTFAKLKSKLDTVYLDIRSKKSRRLMQKRTIGYSHVKTSIWEGLNRSFDPLLLYSQFLFVEKPSILYSTNCFFK